MARSYSRRARGEGSIYETGDGQLRGSLLIPHPDDSRSIRRVVSGRTKAEVVRKLDALKRETAAGYASGETAGEYLERWSLAR